MIDIESDVERCSVESMRRPVGESQKVPGVWNKVRPYTVDNYMPFERQFVKNI